MCGGGAACGWRGVLASRGLTRGRGRDRLAGGWSFDTPQAECGQGMGRDILRVITELMGS